MISKFIKLSDFLKLEIKPFILGAFLSRIMEYNEDKKHYFYAYSSFKSSKYVFKSDFDFEAYSAKYIEKLNYFSGHYNWSIHKVSDSAMDVRFYVLDDLNVSKTYLFKTLYQYLLKQEYAFDDILSDNQKDFIRGFIELRGSVDTTAKFIAQDYFYNDRLELKKAQILTNQLKLPIQYANFNMRDLQPQYVSGENQRNAQFRINAFFYAKEIGFINDYKAKIFEKAYYTRGKNEINKIVYFDVDLPNSRNDDVAFIKMINFFTNNVYEKQLSTTVVKELRSKLGFDSTSDGSQKRDMSIIKLLNEISPDKCAICGTEKTYTNPKTGRQQFEIHHMISFKNGKELDNIANLVKLCPTCHGKLGRGSADKIEQTSAICKILHEHNEIFEFASSYLAIDDINVLTEKIWEMLG